MNFKRQLLDEWENLLGYKPLGNILVIFESNPAHNNYPEYIAALANQAASHPDGCGYWGACWEFFRQAFECDDKAMWKWFRDADNDELVAILLGHVFENDPEKALVFLRKVMDEEGVQRFIESDEEGSMVQDYGIEYKPFP